MAITKIQIRPGAYYDSVVLMQLQAELKRLPGIRNTGAMMGTTANKDLLRQNDLFIAEADKALPHDLIIAIKGDNTASVDAALAQVDSLLSHKQATADAVDYQPKSLAAANRILPDANWVQISVPGIYAAGVAREALSLEKNVFLYSDHVSLQDEISLKKEAANRGLLVLGPDCGTVIINGTGLGFANKVRRGPIGLIGASGTGLQQVTSRIHQLGSGITHALGTGGRDLAREAGGLTTRQCLDLLSRDPETEVIVVISKPPAREVAAGLIRDSQKINKPVIFNFIGYYPAVAPEQHGNVFFTTSLDDVAEKAVGLAGTSFKISHKSKPSPPAGESQGFLRGFFSGGTLAYETLRILQDYLPVVYSNIPLKKEYALPDAKVSKEHTILDLGEDKFTGGRPHPMIDNTLRLERFTQEAADSSVAVILLDVVLGYGAHPDPAAEFAPAISRVLTQAKKDGRNLEVVAILVGTDEDLQNLDAQIDRLKTAGARVETSVKAAAMYVGQRLQSSSHMHALKPVDPAVLQQPVKAINIGLELFNKSLVEQGARVIHVDWRPPAGGDEKLISILERMR